MRTEVLCIYHSSVQDARQLPKGWVVKNLTKVKNYCIFSCCLHQYPKSIWIIENCCFVHLHNFERTCYWNWSKLSVYGQSWWSTEWQVIFWSRSEFRNDMRHLNSSGNWNQLTHLWYSIFWFKMAGKIGKKKFNPYQVRGAFFSWQYPTSKSEVDIIALL